MNPEDIRASERRLRKLVAGLGQEESLSLVPKLRFRLGTHFPKLCFATSTPICDGFDESRLPGIVASTRMSPG